MSNPGRPIRFETEVYLQKLTDAEGRPLVAEASPSAVRAFVRQHFAPALRRLFPGMEL